jgi:hypothetical protein
MEFIPLYHVTLKTNIESIYDNGLQPHLATGKEAKTWLVSEEKLLWAIAHCANRHNVLISNLAIIPVHAIPAKISNTQWQGIYTSTVLLHATNHPTNAAHMIDKLGLAQ